MQKLILEDKIKIQNLFAPRSVSNGMKLNFIKWFLGMVLIFGAIGLVLPEIVSADFTPLENSHASSLTGFTLSPAKLEITMRSGEKTIRTLTFKNDNTEAIVATISFEDFAVQSDAYSLLPYLSTPVRSIKLAAGESVQVPIAVELPPAPPVGSFHSAVIFSVASGASKSNLRLATASRVGALVFVRLIEAIAKPSGQLTKFGLLNGRLLRANQPPTFYLNYTNTGNVYLNPYGIVILTNRLTAAERIQVQAVDPWFVLPENSRTREITFATGLPSGWYEARVALNRGYADFVDETAVSFFVWSWPLIISLVTVFVILASVFWFIMVRIRKIKK